MAHALCGRFDPLSQECMPCRQLSGPKPGAHCSRAGSHRGCPAWRSGQAVGSPGLHTHHAAPLAQPEQPAAAHARRSGAGSCIHHRPECTGARCAGVAAACQGPWCGHAPALACPLTSWLGGTELTLCCIPAGLWCVGRMKPTSGAGWQVGAHLGGLAAGCSCQVRRQAQASTSQPSGWHAAATRAILAATSISSSGRGKLLGGIYSLFVSCQAASGPSDAALHQTAWCTCHSRRSAVPRLRQPD